MEVALKSVLSFFGEQLQNKSAHMHMLESDSSLEPGTGPDILSGSSRKTLVRYGCF